MNNCFILYSIPFFQISLMDKYIFSLFSFPINSSCNRGKSKRSWKFQHMFYFAVDWLHLNMYNNLWTLASGWQFCTENTLIVWAKYCTVLMNIVKVFWSLYNAMSTFQSPKDHKFLHWWPIWCLPCTTYHNESHSKRGFICEGYFPDARNNPTPERCMMESWYLISLGKVIDSFTW